MVAPERQVDVIRHDTGLRRQRGEIGKGTGLRKQSGQRRAPAGRAHDALDDARANHAVEDVPVARVGSERDDAVAGVLEKLLGCPGSPAFRQRPHPPAAVIGEQVFPRQLRQARPARNHPARDAVAESAGVIMDGGNRIESNRWSRSAGPGGEREISLAVAPAVVLSGGDNIHFLPRALADIG